MFAVNFSSVTTSGFTLTQNGVAKMTISANYISPNDSKLYIRPSLNGDGVESQKIIIILKNTSSGLETKLLTTDGQSVSSDNYAIISTKGTWNFEARVSAYSNTNNEGAGWNFRGIIKKNSSGYTILPSIISESWSEDSLQDAIANISINNSRIEVSVTGVTGQSIKWTCVFEASAYESQT